MVSEFSFSKEEDEDDEECIRNHVYLYFVLRVILHTIFLQTVTFGCVLHLDVIRSQIELKLKDFPYVWQ